MRARLVVVLLALALVSSGVPLVASAGAGEAELATGIRQVDEGDLDAAVITLDTLIQRLGSAKGREQELALAHLYLGMAHLGLSQWERAKSELREAWRKDPAMRLDPKKFPPRVMQAYAEANPEATRSALPEPASAPGAKSGPANPPKKSGGKGLLILGGVALAGGGIAAAAAGGGGASSGGVARPAGCTSGATPSLSAQFDPALFECPIGAQNLGYSLAIVVSVTNPGCSDLAIQSVSSTLTVVGVGNSLNFIGQIFREDNGAFAPGQVAAGSTGTIRAAIPSTCHNPSGGDGLAFTEYTGQTVVRTSLGSFTLDTSNHHRVNAP